ncbi:MAG: DUF5110 domain-containing protein [Phycisphaeraceae bacterium]|nr:DUF5110 domain-containing protein [Phycisphaeraceae bacterium]
MTFRALCAPLLVMALAAAPTPIHASETPHGGGQPVGQRLAEGAAIYFASEAARDAAPPSMTLLKVPGFQAPGSPRPTAVAVVPVFDVREDGRQRVRIAVPAGTSLYGTGEIAGPLLRNGRVSETWNTDAYGYTEDNKSLYQSHPWVLAVRPDGSAFGVLADTTWRCEIDLTDGITFAATGPSFGVVVIERSTPQDVLRTLGTLTGTMPLPPRWAIGYHQCRYSYNPESRVREIADEFRKRSIPCSVIWFDIDYMDGYRVFTFDKQQFPDVPKLNADLGAMGFRRIWMIDPGIKHEAGYSISDQLLAADLAVKTAAGEVYRGEVWPGWCVFPDYTAPAARAWWAGLYKDFMATGISGVWNDMNEPAVFNVATKTMPEDNRHVGGAWRPTPNADERTLPAGPHAQYHNVYGMLMAQGTFDGILAARPAVRPFVLTRAGFIGSQRYAATWTGDNSAEWDDLEHSVSMALNLGLSGQPFAGPDIGGFNGNGPTDPDERKMFYARWFGFGAMLPFARGHTGKGNIDKEPWAFGPEAESIIRTALQRRYVLLPYYYTLFREASVSGLPVMRPLFFADPSDPALRSEDDAFLIGNDLLVSPRMTPLADRLPVRPKGDWRPVAMVGEAPHRDLPDLFIRAGAIIPTGPIQSYTDEKPLDPLTLIVAPDSAGEASGLLYEDAGDGFEYLKGQYLLSRYSAVRQGGDLVVTVQSAEGGMPRPARTVNVHVILPNGREVTGSGPDGQPVRVALPG